MESLSSTRSHPSNRTTRYDDDASRLGGAFGVYDEGDGLHALYATPIDTACLGRALDALRLGGTLLDVTPERGIGPAREVSRERLTSLAEPLELVHAPSATEGPRETLTLMAAPHVALPRDGGRVLGFSLHDRGHGVLYTREPRVLAAVLAAWLLQVVDTLTAPSASPPIPPNTLASVMAPIPPQAWRRVMLDRGHHIWSLDLSALVNDDDGRSEIIDDLTWVGGPGRAWRAGWSW